MSIRLKDIPRFLRVVSLFEKKGKFSKYYVQKTFNDEPIKEARLPNYSELEKLCHKFKIIETTSDDVRMTELGKEILRENQNESFISDRFKEFFVKNCLLKGDIGEQIIQSLSKFHENDDQKRWYPKWQIYNLFEMPEILPILYDVGLIEKNDITVEINSKYSKLIYRTSEVKKLTQRQLENQLKIFKIIGEIAEEIILTYEKERLKNKGCSMESDKVKRISIEYTDAGYDVLSFNGKADGFDNYDRFIEVKGSSGTEFEFNWSTNEVKTAESLGDKYWIYFVGGIDINLRKSDLTPEIIQNPYRRIFKNESFNIEISGYHITKKAKGGTEN